MESLSFAGRGMRGLALAAVVLAMGCYTYVPVSTTPTVGERVRVALTSEGVTELARYLGPRVVLAEGDLTRIQNDSAMVVAVDFVRMADGTRQPWNGEGVVTFPRHYVAEVRERNFLKNRSIVVGTALTGAVAAIAIIALQAGGAGGGDCPACPPPPP